MAYTAEELAEMSGRRLEAVYEEVRRPDDASGSTIRKKNGPEGLVAAILERQKAAADPAIPQGDMARPERFKTLDKTTRRLPVPLTDDEWRHRAARLAQVEDEVSNEEEYQKQVKTDLKARRARLEAERSQLALCVRQKTEIRDVGIEFVADYEEGIVREQRIDTGAVLETRPLSTEERQPKLFDE